MQAFLHRINVAFDYRQFIPNKPKKRKGTLRNIANSLSGLTGDALLEKVYELLKQDSVKSEVNNCAAVIIEDDLDGHQTDNNAQSQIADTVHGLLGNNNIPVIILYAAPEIEAWFLADWNNSFEKVYEVVDGVDVNVCKLFIHDLNTYIKSNVFDFDAANPEDYDVNSGGKYHKLSDDLIAAFDKVYEVVANSDAPQGYKEQIAASRGFYYSKKEHGVRMLRNIDPVNVENKCRKHFNNAKLQIEQLQ